MPCSPPLPGFDTRASLFVCSLCHRDLAWLLPLSGMFLTGLAHTSSSGSVSALPSMSAYFLKTSLEWVKTHCFMARECWIYFSVWAFVQSSSWSRVSMWDTWYTDVHFIVSYIFILMYTFMSYFKIWTHHFLPPFLFSSSSQVSSLQSLPSLSNW